MSTYIIQIKISPTEYKSFSVPNEVAIYIKQLECYISNPQESKLKELYPNRFNKKLKNNI